MSRSRPASPVPSGMSTPDPKEASDHQGLRSKTPVEEGLPARTLLPKVAYEEEMAGHHSRGMVRDVELPRMAHRLRTPPEMGFDEPGTSRMFTNKNTQHANPGELPQNCAMKDKQQDCSQQTGYYTHNKSQDSNTDIVRREEPPSRDQAPVFSSQDALNMGSHARYRSAAVASRDNAATLSEAGCQRDKMKVWFRSHNSRMDFDRRDSYTEPSDYGKQNNYPDFDPGQDPRVYDQRNNDPRDYDQRRAHARHQQRNHPPPNWRGRRRGSAPFPHQHMQSLGQRRSWQHFGSTHGQQQYAMDWHGQSSMENPADLLQHMAGGCGRQSTTEEVRDQGKAETCGEHPMDDSRRGGQSFEDTHGRQSSATPGNTFPCNLCNVILQNIEVGSFYICTYINLSCFVYVSVTYEAVAGVQKKPVEISILTNS